MSRPTEIQPIDSVREYAELAHRTLSREVEVSERGIHVLIEEPRSLAMLNAATGLSSETGEVNELIKKRFFHFHPWTEQNQIHMEKELGDLCWYIVLMMWCHRMDPAYVFGANIAKLKARYPEGFSTEKSLNRAEGDI